MLEVIAKTFKSVTKSLLIIARLYKMNYKEPPMKFNPATRKYEVDLELKIANENPVSEKQSLLALGFFLAIILLIFIIIYVSSKVFQ